MTVAALEQPLLSDAHIPVLETAHVKAAGRRRSFGLGVAGQHGEVVGAARLGLAHRLDKHIADDVAYQDGRAVAEDRLHPLASEEGMVRLGRTGELAILSEQGGQRGVVAIVRIFREKVRQFRAGVLDPEVGEFVHYWPASSASISASASPTMRKLSTAAGMPA